MGNSTAFTATVLDLAGITGTSEGIGPLPYGSVYFWEVRAANINGLSAWAGPWSFTTVDNYNLWSSHKTITFNTTTSGAAVYSVNQINFPVLVRLISNGATSSNTPGFSANGLNDIRFSKSNYTQGFPYQIDYLSPTLDTAAIWVLVDTVYANSASQTMVMHYGNASAQSESNGNAVFDTGKTGYRDVWHLGEAGNNTAGGYKDATVHGANGTGTNMVGGTSDTAGVIGKAQSFNGSTQFITMGYNTTGISGNVNRSIEGWIKGNTTTAGACAFGLAPNDGTTNAWFLISPLYSGNGDYDLSLQNHDYSVSTLSSDKAWHHFTATWNGTTASLYVDGGGKTASGAPGNLVTVDSFMVGMRGYGSIYFQGVVDEVRLSSVARTAAWDSLSYANQNPANQTLLSYGLLANPTLAAPANGALGNQPR